MNRKRTTLALAAILVLGLVASAEDDVTSLSYISYMERYATVQPAAQADSLEAALNMPVVAGDRIDTARGARLEVHLADGSLLWMDQYTTLSFDAIAFSRASASDRTVLYLAEGGVVVEVPQTAYATEPMRLDSASSTVHLHGPGAFRADALRSGSLRLEVWEGLAEVSTPAGGVLVRAGTAAEIAGGEILRDELALTEDDEFAYWVAQRRLPPAGDSTRHLEAQYARQGNVLDSYGNWVYVDTVGSWAWRPHVSVGWRPYTAGRWYWTTVGWNWISYEPWGWLPYHYGSWHFDAGFGWLWLWDSYWSPAWVSWVRWPGYVGWCPRGYYDWWYWDHYGDPGYGGGGGGIGRGDVLPPRLARAGATVRSRTLDLDGRVDPRQLDPGGWTVVRTGDFDSPHLPRLVTTPDRAVRGAGEVDRGLVHTGPLVTPAPGAEPIGRVLDGGFRDVGPAAHGDLTPILARRGDLAPSDARALVRPTTAGEIVRRAPTPVRVPSVPDRAAAAPAPGRTVGRDAPNVHRPTIGSGSPGTVDRTPVTPRAVTPRAPERRPTITPSGPSTSRPSTGSVRPAPAPSTRPSPSNTPQARPSSPPSRSVTPRSGAVSRSSAPVIVPRSPSATSQPSARSVPRSSYRTPPARTAPRPSTPSSSVRPSTRPSGGSSTPSVRPSRPSGSSSARPSSRPSSGGSSSPSTSRPSRK